MKKKACKRLEYMHIRSMFFKIKSIIESKQAFFHSDFKDVL